MAKLFEAKEMNFSCNLFIETEFDPFQRLADEAGIDKTAYFRIMLKGELKKKSVLKAIQKAG